MKLADVGWVWEGQGLDPGVHPSIFGVGEGAEYFGLRRARLMFHPTDNMLLEKVRHLEEVTCDISKWKFRDCGERGGSECYVDAALASILEEAGRVGAFSLRYPNIVAAYFDDMKGLVEREHHSPEDCGTLRDAVRKTNPKLKLDAVVYAHELEDKDFWQAVSPAFDRVSFWVWGYQHLGSLERFLEECRELFPGKPILMGCYLRDYPTRAPVPMDAVRGQLALVEKALSKGAIAGFEILASVLIDGHQEQARWIRDFISTNS